VDRRDADVVRSFVDEDEAGAAIRGLLLREVLAAWSTAPVSEVGASGRWLTFARPGGGTVYAALRLGRTDRAPLPGRRAHRSGPGRAAPVPDPERGDPEVVRLLVRGPVPRRNRPPAVGMDTATAAGRRPAAAPAA
jgi:hypothetical protein